MNKKAEDEGRTTKRVKLPEIRCDAILRNTVMTHASKKGLPYSRYVLNLIRADLASEDLEEGYTAQQLEDGERKIVGTREIGVSLPENVRVHLEAIKARDGISLSEQIRKIVMTHHGDGDLGHKELMELIRTNNLLIAAGRNLNQLMRKVNSGEAIVASFELLEEVLRVVEQAIADVNEFKNRLGL